MHPSCPHLGQSQISAKPGCNGLQEKLNSDNAIRGPAAGGNKLRTYRTFKKHYCTEPYVEVITAKRYRSAYAKFRWVLHRLKLKRVDTDLIEFRLTNENVKLVMWWKMSFMLLCYVLFLMTFVFSLWYRSVNLTKILRIYRYKNSSLRLCQIHFTTRLYRKQCIPF